VQLKLVHHVHHPQKLERGEWNGGRKRDRDLAESGWPIAVIKEMKTNGKVFLTKRN
jgi:hypothetical protein